VVGEHYGRVRAMHNDKGGVIEEAGPSIPVEVHGLSGVPRAGDEFIVVPDEKTARTISGQRHVKVREQELATTTKISLENLFEHLEEGEIKELRVVLRADVQGTLEAFGSAIEKLSTDEVKVKIIHSGTGAIIESDILLADASQALIFGFNVRPTPKAKELARSESVDIRFYDVIYHALDDIKLAMTGLLEPTFEEEMIGTVEVRETFHHPKAGTIAGCYVTDGNVTRKAEVRLVRDGVVVYTGKIDSLRRFKDDVKEVQAGFECGISVENFNDIKVGDVIEAFLMKEVAGVL
jgi:translation initiation factor IF-2